MDAQGKADRRRADLAGRIAGVLLERGVAAIPLRDLAARLSTSDRMLLYYFGTQAGLTDAVLAHLSNRLSAQLEAALPPGRLLPGRLLRRLIAFLGRPDIARILRVWADVTARGSRGEVPFAEFAKGSVAFWQHWIAARLDISGRARRDAAAAAILVVIEGLRMVAFSAPGAARAAAPVLTKALAG